ncbi:ULK/ULK protein kinase [Thecamonas trahens ATCC 50062]|uniref:ULK/ULK protein kinase n=1 Tax=Thecamonas trahens ATCC 50062 TaxID=461836 RepID=A0A0L0DS80_THETB|nr:ULK/ULK protein kinase [Thecamonas trahens ATCC 50062]KNC54896.1 ULK/ULK protein kinase [Thecamonas trahens ATCC 50062]|eukprot:XP_013753487.1 ULK/ULK protein kinase [Thecamonas trahens ATCC 50062]
MAGLAWEDYLIQSKIGTGAFSTVYKAQHKVTKNLVAIKAIRRARLSKKQQANLKLEQSILKSLDDDNVVQLYEIMKTEKHIYLIMEFCGGGDLHKFIKDRGSLPEAVAIHCLREIAAGLRVLQDRNLIHRDLKPQNLLIGAPVGPNGMPSLKLADFGLARYIEEEDLAATLCGSPTYMAPEVLSGKPYSAKADLWSVGAIFFEMLTGTPPFVASNHIELLRKMQRAPPPIPRAAKISSTSRYLIQSCLLIVNPAKRISFDEFFTHPYVTYKGPIALGAAGTGAGADPAAAATPPPAAAATAAALAGYSAPLTPSSASGSDSGSDSSDADDDDKFYSALAAKHKSRVGPARLATPARDASFYSDEYYSDDDGESGPEAVEAMRARAGGRVRPSAVKADASAAQSAAASARTPLTSNADNVLQEELARLERLKARHQAALRGPAAGGGASVAAVPARKRPPPPAVQARQAYPGAAVRSLAAISASVSSSRSGSGGSSSGSGGSVDFDVWRQRAMEKIAQMNAMLDAQAQ